MIRKTQWGEEFEGSGFRIGFGHAQLDRSALLGQIQGLNLVEMNQVHDRHIHEAGELLPPCDGLTTTKSDQVLMVKTADCLPIMLATGERIFALHAGWRGLVKGLLFSTTKWAPFDIHTQAVIGPHIQFSSFEVGLDVVNEVLRSLDQWSRTYEEEKLLAPHRDLEKRYLNLSYLASWQLRALNIPEENILVSQVDTLTNPQWHSYRRQGLRSGRNLHWIYRS